MAKYTINHTCGHEVTIQLYGKHTERDRKIAWLETQPCRHCENEAANKAAAERAEEAGLPALEGTEKQVAWATTIRDRALSQIAEGCQPSELFRTLKSRGFSNAYAAELGITSAETFTEFCQKVEKFAREIDVAAWWIDYRAGAADQAIEVALDNLAPRK